MIVLNLKKMRGKNYWNLLKIFYDTIDFLKNGGKLSDFIM